ncbi:MAG: mechanosensitive ion channel [Planctomycetaceae bacterium]
MLRLAAGVCGMIALYLIWIDVLPALGFLRDIQLWQNGLAGPDDDAFTRWITAADLLVGVLIAGLTLLASRNLPGMMEIALLQRLPLDAGARYAATTVSRYVIVVTGIVFGFRTIGVGWSSVQWLVAAMTVGLGFGLQEIFANFVSGIILLFERPIRVGDLVTIGGSSGTVTRIQIRATTILDWDYKELIVPNREFVTGNLVNWTLSSPILRMVIRISIPGGSDARRATELLLQAASENLLVLADPAPSAVFTQIGASSLDFELRLYVSGPRNYDRTQHELHRHQRPVSPAQLGACLNAV